MRLKESRIGSFLVILVVYVLALALGIDIYRLVKGYHWFRILVADMVVTVFVFLFSCIFGNASMYDPYWSVQPVVILLPLAFAAPTQSKLVLAFVILLWGIRLTGNWAYTFHGLGHQDWRYTQLHDKTGMLYPFVNLAGIHMFPTIVVFMCILPGIFVMDESPAFNPLCMLGATVSVGAVVLEFVSDIQMQRYRRNRNSAFMEQGVWKYSMHPNYLGEILMWWGVAIYAVALLGFRWYLLAGALMNNLMFLFISIPMADKRQSTKPGYDEYREGKNMLLPFRFR